MKHDQDPPEDAIEDGTATGEDPAFDEANRDRLVARLRRATAGRAAGDVFGCALASPAERNAP